MTLKAIFVAAVHGVNAFTSKLLESSEFKALEAAALPLAGAAVTAALAPEIGPAAPLVGGLATTVIREGVAGLDVATAKIASATVQPAHGS